LWFNASWDNARNLVDLMVINEVMANENISFAFVLRNPGVFFSPVTVYIGSQIGDVRFPSVPMDGVLSFTEARFQTRSIGQSSPFPGAQNYLTVTFATNVPIVQEARNVITISGLRGLSMTDGVLPLFGLDSSTPPGCWLPCDKDGPACSGFAVRETQGYGIWNKERQSLSFTVVKSIPANQSINFRFKVLNPPAPQQSPAISIAMITGSVPISYATMEKDQGFPYLLPSCANDAGGAPACGETSRAGDAAALKIRGGEFEYLDSCIAQTSKFPGGANTITATIATSVPISAFNGEAFYLSGLSGATMERGSASAVFSVIDCFGNHSGTVWASVAWNDQLKRVDFVLAGVTAPFSRYIVSFDVTNPAIPQDSPDITLGLHGFSFPSVVLCKDPLNPPLLVERPRLTATVCQTSALPGVLNDIHVNFSTSIPLLPILKAKIVVSGFYGLTLTCNPMAAGCVELRGSDAYLFGGLYGAAGLGTWNGADMSLSVLVVNSTAQDAQYDLSFSLKNPFVAQGAQPVAVKFFLGDTMFDAWSSTCEDIYAPGFVAENKVLFAGIFGSTNYPGALNQVVLSLKMQLAVEDAPDITVSGLVGSLTPSSQSLALGCPSCCGDVDNVNCTCPMNNRPCDPSLVSAPCAQDLFNGTAAWFQTGRLKLVPTGVLKAGFQYYFSVDLQNPIANQENRPIELKFSVPSIAAVEVA
jgi:hypothetical protein